MEPKSKCKLSPPEAVAASAALIAMVFGNDDILREILLRLGFPTCLVRAAAVCKDWYRIASDPDFLRRFRALNPPHLLGFYNSARLRLVPRPHPPELASAVRRCNSFDLGCNVSSIYDCRNGHLLLATSDGFTICSPLNPERGQVAIPDLPRIADLSDYEESDEEEEDDDGTGDDNSCPLWWSTLDGGLLLADDGGDALSCIDVTLMFNWMGILAHVRDFEAGAWNEGRRSEVILNEDLPELFVPAAAKFGLFAHGKVYMICMEHHILVLDLHSTSLFFVKFPEGVEYVEADANVGLSRAEGSGICLIHVEGLQLFVWENRMDCGGGGDNWKLVDTVCLGQAFGDLADPAWLSGEFVMYVYDVGDNAEYVFLEMQEQIFYMHVSSRRVEKVLDGETGEKVLDGEPRDSTFLSNAFPMMMVWPPTFPSLKI